MNILVTGGAGYIGSHTSKALAIAGMTPIVLDNLSTGHVGMVKWGPLVRDEVGDRRTLRRLFRNHRIDGVIHFAASAYVGESMLHPRRYFQNNIVNSLTLCEEMLDAGINNIVFSSSCATYGIPSQIPVTEGEQQHPVNPYGESKLFIERALRAFESAYGLNWVALRYFNAAGADPEGEVGERHEPEAHLIPAAIEAAVGHRPALEVFGTDYATPDGTAVRDFIHVSDLADAHVRALEYLFAGQRSVALNLGTGRGHSVHEVVAMVEAVGGRTVPILAKPRRPGDPPKLVADASLARATLGWKPGWTDLRSTIETAWAWHDSNRIPLVGAGIASTAALVHHD